MTRLLPVAALVVLACAGGRVRPGPPDRPSGTPFDLLVIPAEREGEPVRLQISLGEQNDQDCRILSPKARLVVDGRPMKMTWRGSGTVRHKGLYGIPFLGPTSCTGAKFEGELPARSGDVAIVLDDDGDKLVDAIYSGLLAVRRLQLVSPADGVIHLGTRVVVRWTPQCDRLLKWTGKKHNIEGWFSTPQMNGGATGIGMDTELLDGPQVAFTNQNTLGAQPVRGELKLGVAAVHLRASKCRGDYACVGRVWGDFTDGAKLPTVPATIAP